MGLKIAIYDKKKEDGFIFENNCKGIGDFLIQLNTELYKHNFDLRIGKYGKGFGIDMKKED